MTIVVREGRVGTMHRTAGLAGSGGSGLLDPTIAGNESPRKVPGEWRTVEKAESQRKTNALLRGLISRFSQVVKTA